MTLLFLAAVYHTIPRKQQEVQTKIRNVPPMPASQPITKKIR